MAMRILVVDDSLPIREGLSALLYAGEEAFGDLVQVQTAENGLTALALLQAQPFDVVLTDICMPEMTGLALMEQCAQQSIAVPFLIISGYDDFHYAQKAMEFGAGGYLLKPINCEALYAAILRVWKKTHHAAPQTQEQALLAYVQGVTAQVPCEMLLAQHPFLQEPFSLVWVETAAAVPSNFDGCCLPQAEGAYLLCAQGEALCTQLAARSFVALVTHVAEICALPQAYAALQETLVHRILFPEERVLRWEQIRPLQTDFSLPHREMEKLREMVGACSEAKLTAFVGNLFERRVLTHYRIGYTMALCDMVYRTVRQIELSVSPQENGAAAEQLKNLFAFASIRAYLSCLQMVLHSLSRTVQQHKEQFQENVAMEQAIAYLKNNFRNPITMSFVANRVSLSYTYFSNVFHKRTGKSFPEYLRDVRIDESKKLLLQTNDSIMEIARQVGYDSYKTFARSFKECTGVSPAEYRRTKQLLP